MYDIEKKLEVFQFIVGESVVHCYVIVTKVGPRYNTLPYCPEEGTYGEYCTVKTLDLELKPCESILTNLSKIRKYALRIRKKANF